MSITTFEAIPSHAELLAIAQSAAARHLHLITDGQRSVLCSIIPPGWRLMRVVVKPINPKAA